MVVSNIPYANYGQLSGQLFLYAQGRAAFETTIAGGGAELSSNKCILLGGLSDGLLPVPYTQRLADACQEHDWSLVQPILSSSYLGFGHGSLQRDCEELQELVRYLTEYRNGKEFALVGHSTGCQDAVYFLKHADSELRSKFRMVALQAPVSDRGGVENRKGFSEKLAHAQTLVQGGKGQEMLPRSHHWAPITAQRFVDLHEKGGADDFFSSDFTDVELAERLGHVGTHDNLNMLVVFSGSDEYVPSHVDSVALTDRLVEAMNSNCSHDKRVAESLYLETGNHNLSEGPNDSQTFVDRISDILNRIKK
jgi:alpha-beta hydrolase superfamily lysophospholipase